MDAVVSRDDDFRQRVDALGRKGISTLQKCSAAMRMLAYGCCADLLDDNVGMAESTVLEYTKKFCEAVIAEFESEYLRTPTHSDITRQLNLSADRGFPGCIGSLDCMHWMWEMCPYALKGQFSGKEGKPSFVLEVVADYRLRIWHFNFGSAGSNNDINIVNSSPLLNRHIIQHAEYDAFSYTVAGKDFQNLYYLVDGIYPSYACFMLTISKPKSAKEKHFAKQQEAALKDVERAFGVLQKRFRILKLPSQIWYAEDMVSVIKACVILHNMIVEDEWAVDDLEDLPEEDTHVETTSRAISRGVRASDEQLDVSELITRPPTSVGSQSFSIEDSSH
ncbi:unnamed protein product [Phytophthora fragariaefolia]|uniref:Unnamed protein product n=1 Tax=Phytophthora fragariaefolia TaxID=1490495 RepID=A0A9W6XKA7_9STRA|nr:unnamed protein product [Phytophthora fragariaefolia]